MNVSLSVGQCWSLGVQVAWRPEWAYCEKGGVCVHVVCVCVCV